MRSRLGLAMTLLLLALEALLADLFHVVGRVAVGRGLADPVERTLERVAGVWPLVTIAIDDLGPDDVFEHKNERTEVINPLVCSLCYKCVEACGDDAQHTYAIAVSGRGFDSRISDDPQEDLIVIPHRAERRIGEGLGEQAFELAELPLVVPAGPGEKTNTVEDGLAP